MNHILKSMTQEEFEAAVQAKVEETLSSKEDAQARAEAEEALKEAKDIFESLKSALEAKDAKIKEYEEALANLDVSDPTEVEVAANDKIVELEEKVKELEDRAAVAEAALDTIAREETAATRMVELKDSGVCLEDGNAEKQYAKVRDMSDEEFISYRDELVALKSLYNTGSEESEEEELQVANLSSEDIRLIAQSLGCDPTDSKCISLVNEVAQKVAEVSNNRTKPANEDAKTEETTKTEETAEETPEKEVASKKETFSLGEAISRALDQDLQAPKGLKDQLTQAWEEVYAAKHREKSE
jgi:hypothetical protein